MTTKYTLWIHVNVNHHIHETYKVDLCVDTNHEYSIETWTRMM
jgi:hypothetical protein